MLGTIEGRRRRGQQRLKWLDGVTETVSVSFNGLQRRVENRKLQVLKRQKRRLEKRWRKRSKMVKICARGRVMLSSILLTAVLFAEFAQSLQCFSCREPTRPEKCMTIINCMPNQTMCMTTMHSLEEVYPFVGEFTVTRSCSLTCNLSEIDEIGSTRLLTCCHSNLCNHNGACWLELSYTMLGGMLVSFFFILT
ncbi:ly6/PLAUR domain-containing protein 2-like [Erythrolamprus reginae]|uniref:ly6/PLAUR domain-containing protein 2-like n=1 Tax=Erythrolamprus reginae TaxID=121349 RepID=UPI00396C3E2A